MAPDTQLKFNISNYSEDWVFEHIKSRPDVLNKGNDFINDVACIALNRISPHYVREKIYLFAHMTDADWICMNMEIEQAVNFAICYVETHLKR
jgi:competence protein ComFB